MKRNIIYLFVILLITHSCCNEDPVETARYELSDQELMLIPYNQGESISFKHSNGFEFSLYVSELIVKWEEYHEFCEWFCCPSYFFSYQIKRAKLQADYPKLNIGLSIGSTQYGNYSPMELVVDLNNRHFAHIHYDSAYHFVSDTVYKAILYESIIINDKVYSDVVEKFFDYHYYVQDTSILLPKSILFNRLGVLQIKMSNDETYSINN